MAEPRARRFAPASGLGPGPGLRRVLQEARADIPLRAKSVSLSERPRSKYSRNIHSADSRSRHPNKHFVFQNPPPRPKPRRNYKKVDVKLQNRKVIEKVPCAISVQTLSIPMKYAPKHSTSKPASSEHADYRTKYSNPPKQVSDNRRLCTTQGCGKETENKLLVQICEAKQVSDFERILNSNAILCESGRGPGHVWRGVAGHASSAARPRSAYSLSAASRAYHHLFKQHEDSLQPLIQQYRQTAIEKRDPETCPPVSILQQDWFENLQNLSEFYEDDNELHEEIETITDKIVDQEIKATTETENLAGKNKNFNVNLTDLIGLHVNGEAFRSSPQEGPSPEADRKAEQEEDKEWLEASMSANSEFEPISKDSTESVDCLAQELDSVNIDSDAKVPTITFSNCCDGCARSELPNNNEVVIHLSVPSIQSDEARPPM